MRIAAFPKCYLDVIAHRRTMTVFEWIDQAQQLSAEGLEMYEGFFTSFDDPYIDRVREATHAVGFALPMLCCSPDFTDPNGDARKRAVEHEAHMIRVARRLGGPRTTCRVLTGQRRPDVHVEQGLEWVVAAIEQLLPVAREYDVVLALENHYKDGHWEYPEFAQKQDVFLRVLAAIGECKHFGVQFDPSNALVAGDDPVALLQAVLPRVVSMHASDRYLTNGVTLDELRQHDGTLGYSLHLRHGVTGEGLNDYDTIFKLLRDADYNGWVSIEDGMNGMDEMQRSIQFLQRMRAKYWGT